MSLSASYNRMLTMAVRLMLVMGVLVVGTPTVKSTQAWQPITFGASAVAPLQDDSWSALQLDDGILFVWNRPDLHFTLTIKGTDISPLNDPNHIFFKVDGKVLQIQMASVSEFAANAKEKKLDDKSILAAHRDWEAKFLEGVLQSKVKVQLISANLSNVSEVSAWQFDMPENLNAEAKKQIYVSVVTKPYVLVLNGVATATVSDEVARKFLLETMSTLKVSPTRIDIKKLSESLREGLAP